MSSAVSTIIKTLVSSIECTSFGRYLASDLSAIEEKLNAIYTSTFTRIETQDLPKIISFLKDLSLVQQCILPSVEKLHANGRVSLDTKSIPLFLNALVNIYENIDADIKTASLSLVSVNDIIELSGLLLKTTFTLLIKDGEQWTLALTLIDSAVRMIKMNLSCKTHKSKFFGKK